MDRTNSIQNDFRKALVTVVCIVVVGHSASAEIQDSGSADACASALVKPLVRIVDGALETDAPIIEEAANAIQTTWARYTQLFEGQETFLWYNMMNRVSGQNLLVTGPGGGNKTGGIRWLMPGIWARTMNEWMNDSQVFGGRTKEGIDEGRDLINTSGSAFEAEYVLLDEVPNANPVLFTTLMSYLNPYERTVSFQGVEKRSKTRAVWSTGNATRLQMLKSFWERGIQSGPAFLNRYFYKLFIPNWLQLEQQLRLNRIYQRVYELKSDAQFGTVEERDFATQELKAMQPVAFNPDVVTRLAAKAFVISPSLDLALTQLANRLHEKMNAETLKTRIASRSEQSDPNQIPFESATEWSERTRRILMQVVRESAALDLLRMPDATLRANLLKKPITLSAASAWRTVQSIAGGPGLSYFDPRKLQMVFNLIRGKDNRWRMLDTQQEAAHSRDPLEAASWTELEIEQRIFNSELSTEIKRHIDAAKQVAALDQMEDDVSFGETDFEHHVFTQLYSAISKQLPE